MAGTGHSYEILNVGDLEEEISRLNALVGGDFSWWSLPHMRKAMTAVPYTLQVNPDYLEETLLRYPSSEDKMALRAKGQAGLLRIWAQDYWRHSGPDTQHISDWLRHVVTIPKMLKKLPRVTLSQSILLAEKWVRENNRRLLKKLSKDAEAYDTGCEPRFLFGDYVWYELLTEPALEWESQQMNNCVHGYGEALKNGTRIFSLRREKKSLITMEILPDNSVKQIRAWGNAIPTAEYRPHLILALNALNVHSDSSSQEARMAGLIYRDKWLNIYEISELFEVDGVKCAGYDEEVHVMSPSMPDRDIATLSGKCGWWKEETRFTPSLYAANGRLYIEEQRAIAKVANHFHFHQYGNNATFLKRSKDGNKWMPHADTLMSWEVGDMGYLMDDEGNIILHKKDDRAYTLMNITEKTWRTDYSPWNPRGIWRSGYFEVYIPDTMGRFTKEDIRQVIQSLNDFAVSPNNVNEEIIGRMRNHNVLYHESNNVWYDFLLEAVCQPMGDVAQANKSHKWLIDHRLIRLMDDDKRIMEVFIDGGEVTGLHNPNQSPERYLMDLCRILNEMNVKPKISFLKNKRNSLVYIKDTWHVASTMEDLQPLLWKQYIRDYPAIISVLVRYQEKTISEMTREERRLRAQTLVGWFMHQKAADLANDLTAYSFLQEAHPLMDDMSEREKKALIKGLSIYLRRTIPRKVFDMSHNPTLIRDLFFKYWRELAEDMQVKVAYYVMENNHIFNKQISYYHHKKEEMERLKRENHSIDERWLDIYPEMGDSLKSVFQKQLYRSIFFACRHPDEYLSSEEDVQRWRAVLDILNDEASPRYDFEKEQIEDLRNILAEKALLPYKNI